MATASASSRIRAPSSASHPSLESQSGARRASLAGSRKVSRSSIGSNGAVQKKRIESGKASPAESSSVPLGTITNRNGSASYDEQYRKMSSSRAMNNGGSEGDRSFDRISGPRSSQGSSRVPSQRVPSALRRLPPGGNRIASRTILPSGTHSSHAPDTSTSSSSHPSSGSSRPAVAALARANGRRSLGATLNAAAAGGAAQHDRDGREIGKLTVDSTSFEEWMKMATDNKINATNTWNFALIDYFHDMSLLRSDNGDGTINFQKASCTLDGCVKVWTSRVDSVVVETGKLLSGLQDDGKEAHSKNSRGRNAEDDDGEDELGEDGEAGPRKKRSRAKEPTLVKSFNQLAVKKLDLEFTVDPLFKKTSADFDEGGAGGLLMNHLGVDSKARVVFDASDVPGQDDMEEEEETSSPAIDEDDDGDVTEMGRQVDEQEQVDLSKLRSKLFGQNDFAHGEEDALGSLLGGMTICPTFSTFRFAPDDNTPFSALMADSAPEPLGTPFMTTPTEPTAEWDDDMNDMPAFDDGMDDAFGDMGAGPSAGLFGAAGDGFDLQDGEFEEGGAMNDLNAEGAAPGRGPLDYTSSLQGLLEGSSDQPFQGDDFFGYFDQRMAKNWAGPEHWKMRNVIASLPGASSTTAQGEKGARKPKEPFVIDFTSPEGVIASKVLFETARGQAGTLLPASKESDDLYLLPEDRHFSSRQLLRLFTKPRAMLNPRRQGQLLNSRALPRTDADADFWVQAAAQNSGSTDPGEGNALGFGGEDGGMPELPFDTQFFHEDDGGFDPMDEATEHALALEPEDEEELATQALKRIRPEYVNYAKKAKRVDVRKLKENIWKELAIVVEDDDEDKEEEEDDSHGPPTPKAGEPDEMQLDKAPVQMKRDPTDPRSFDAVLAGLRKLYPKDRMEEISTSFCFICLLHLANEEGLKIRTAPGGIGGLGMLAGRAIVEDDEDDEDEGGVSSTPARQSKSTSRSIFDQDGEQDDDQDQTRVSFLEQLSIVKDLTAGRSA